jgi:hypothetical protein
LTTTTTIFRIAAFINDYSNLDRFYRHWREDEGVKRAMEQQQIS